MSQTSNELQPSELGTREYWDSVYRTDVEHFKTRGDFGDIWFGEDSALRIIRWIIENVPETDVSIIDLGCGNGMLLIELAREGYNNLTGVDYCQSAIELSEKVANSQEISCIKFKVADLTGDVNHLGSFNIALDKGTYDAVSLNPEDAFVKRRKYIENVASIVSQKGMFIITSCNWTESELVEHFKSEFNVLKILPTPKFQFGGKEGSLVSCVVLKKAS